MANSGEDFSICPNEEYSFLVMSLCSLDIRIRLGSVHFSSGRVDVELSLFFP